MKSILIVDDQLHLQELLSEELKEEGYKVVNIPDAKSLKDTLKNSKPDLVLLDLYLNGLRGWDLLQEIKRECPRLPVLIVTAYDSYSNDPRLSQADGYVIKDFTALDSLKEKIAELIVYGTLKTRREHE